VLWGAQSDAGAESAWNQMTTARGIQEAGVACGIMRAIEISKTGGAEVLVLRELPTPTPGAGQALIQIEAAGVNFIDVYQREGRYPVKVPFVPGQEAAGTVIELGPEVAGGSVKLGDRVVWCHIMGTYAEFAVAPVSRLIAIPEGVSTKQAAAVMLQGMTAHYLAYSTYAIQAGDTVLIHAGAGGVGLLLIQIAKRLGSRVLTTVSTEAKAALAREAGADETILYTTEDFVAKVRESTDGQGVPVVYDSVGKTTFDGSLACLQPRGLMALYGGSSGAVPPFDLIQLSTKGSLFLTRPTMKDYIATRADLEERAGDVLGWVADGRLKLRMEHRYPLEDAAEAHRDLEGRKTTGKVLLIP
jgi:NADPH2:quinone reductase